MEKVKYYIHENDRPLNIEKDGCPLSEWIKGSEGAVFALHPKGFKIFISPEQISIVDEYEDSDPYTVEENLDSEFHRRRIELTVDLLHEAVFSMPTNMPEILDLGCGQGHITEKMRQALGFGAFTGIDCSISAIEYAHSQFPEIDFSVGDAYKNPYASSFFDVVVCNNLWEHVPDPLVLLSQIRRLLKPNGYLIVSTPSRYQLRNLVRILMGKKVVLMSRHHVTEYTVGQIKEQLTYGGFCINNVLSKPISFGNMKANIIRFLFSKFISLIGSHHILESTVFYLAQKSDQKENSGNKK